MFEEEISFGVFPETNNNSPSFHTFHSGGIKDDMTIIKTEPKLLRFPSFESQSQQLQHSLNEWTTTRIRVSSDGSTPDWLEVFTLLSDKEEEEEVLTHSSNQSEGCFDILGKRKTSSASSLSGYSEAEEEEQEQVLLKSEIPIKRRKKGKQARLKALSRTTPSFIVEELKLTQGKGEFTTPEIIIMLFFAYKYFDDFDVYSKIRACMNFSRSRASIRRKIEKIVAQRLNTKGGLLGDIEVRIKSKQMIIKLFWEITTQCIDSDTLLSLKSFAYKMQQEAKRLQFNTKK